MIHNVKLARGGSLRVLVWAVVLLLAIIGCTLVQRAEEQEMERLHPQVRLPRTTADSTASTAITGMLTGRSNDTETPKVFYAPTNSLQGFPPAKPLPQDLKNLLEEADNFTLFSLNPDPQNANTNSGTFYDYEILGDLPLKDKERRNPIITALENGVASGQFKTWCFLPRHGIRAIKGTNSADFIICFECKSLYVYATRGSSVTTNAFITTSEPAAIFNETLQKAGVSLTTKYGGPQTRRISCINNLKQIGLAFRNWAGDNEDKFPFNVSTNAGGTMEQCAVSADGFDLNTRFHFQVMSNDLNTPKILVCPEDKARKPALDFGLLESNNVSYRVRSGTNISDATPKTVLAVCPFDGNILYCDGTAVSKSVGAEVRADGRKPMNVSP